ncbi:demethoxyubiquinone hydroxylase family protein [Caulobacter sp. 17J80-11]|uniref:demethoxyubiquinone hydroxylase family protein n=1 Tax=Caulobacter sp. 17J80-11 TaxID=2763502 RepID=UPI001653C8C2|nr:demethoxyubiquinone hydroxylase family protein [Caulobacter sp. 17J80-11]MBC6982581.1 demethoxyubiquinone hydroxylase family protein [Caulobacter sp. 17J80-11]
MDRTVARILKVNHAGEYGAIRIYRAQIGVAALRCPDLRPFLIETLGHEQSHLGRFAVLMPARGARPCGALWLWGAGGTALGLVTGLLGRRAVLICTEAVERTVNRHLEDQLIFLGERDPELSTAIAEIQAQELGHLEHAVSGRGAKRAEERALDALVAAVVEVLIWLSTQGDSARMARELRRSPAHDASCKSAPV